MIDLDKWYGVESNKGSVETLEQLIITELIRDRRKQNADTE